MTGSPCNSFQTNDSEGILWSELFAAPQNLRGLSGIPEFRWSFRWEHRKPPSLPGSFEDTLEWQPRTVCTLYPIQSWLRPGRREEEEPSGSFLVRTFRKVTHPITFINIPQNQIKFHVKEVVVEKSKAFQLIRFNGRRKQVLIRFNRFFVR